MLPALPPSRAHRSIYAQAQRKVTGARHLCGIFSAISWRPPTRGLRACHPAAAEKTGCGRMRWKPKNSRHHFAFGSSQRRRKPLK